MEEEEMKKREGQTRRKTSLEERRKEGRKHVGKRLRN